MSPNSKSVEDLASKARKLNQKSDELNAIIENLDAKLGSMELGISVWVSDELIDPQSVWDTDSNEDLSQGWIVGFAKLTDRWGLAAKRVNWRCTDKEWGKWVYDSDVENPMPLLKTPRTVRVMAAGKLEAIVQALTEKADCFIENIESAKKYADTK